MVLPPLFLRYLHPSCAIFFTNLWRATVRNQPQPVVLTTGKTAPSTELVFNRTSRQLKLPEKSLSKFVGSHKFGCDLCTAKSFVTLRRRGSCRRLKVKLRRCGQLKSCRIRLLKRDAKSLEEKLRSNENLLEQKNLDIKKLIDEKKEALDQMQILDIEKLMDEKKEAVAAQYAAEATLRRVYANQQDNDSVQSG